MLVVTVVVTVVVKVELGGGVAWRRWCDDGLRAEGLEGDVSGGWCWHDGLARLVWGWADRRRFCGRSSAVREGSRAHGCSPVGLVVTLAFRAPPPAGLLPQIVLCPRTPGPVRHPRLVEHKTLPGTTGTGDVTQRHGPGPGRFVAFVAVVSFWAFRSGSGSCCCVSFGASGRVGTVGSFGSWVVAWSGRSWRFGSRVRGVVVSGGGALAFRGRGRFVAVVAFVSGGDVGGWFWRVAGWGRVTRRPRAAAADAGGATRRPW